MLKIPAMGKEKYLGILIMDQEIKDCLKMCSPSATEMNQPTWAVRNLQRWPFKDAVDRALPS